MARTQHAIKVHTLLEVKNAFHLHHVHCISILASWANMTGHDNFFYLSQGFFALSSAPSALKSPKIDSKSPESAFILKKFTHLTHLHS